MTDIDYIYCDGPVMNEVMVQGDSRMCLFTGSQAVAEKLTVDLKGRVKLEDAGFDWKVRGTGWAFCIYSVSYRTNAPHRTPP